MGNHVSAGGWNTKNTTAVALVGYSTEQQRRTNDAKKIMSIYIYQQQWRNRRRNRNGKINSTRHIYRWRKEQSNY